MNIRFGKFGEAAQRAAELSRKGWDPIDAWESVVRTIFPDSPAYQKKGCPKSAFLGLAEAGHIAGVAPGKYTSSTENKRYAIEALRLLQRERDLAGKPEELWRRAARSATIKHNEQMDVVIGLWEARSFLCQQKSVT
jgi:hypothetical protein